MVVTTQKKVSDSSRSIFAAGLTQLRYGKVRPLGSSQAGWEELFSLMRRFWNHTQTRAWKTQEEKTNNSTKTRASEREKV